MIKKKRTKQTSIYENTPIKDKIAIDIEWKGPYAWPKFETESNLPAIPKHPGVYLQTSTYENGYIIYAAGITRRPIPQRLREHTRKYLSGDYTILDMDAMKHGVRKRYGMDGVGRQKNAESTNAGKASFWKLPKNNYLNFAFS